MTGEGKGVGHLGKVWEKEIAVEEFLGSRLATPAQPQGMAASTLQLAQARPVTNQKNGQGVFQGHLRPQPTAVRGEQRHQRGHGLRRVQISGDAISHAGGRCGGGTASCWRVGRSLRQGHGHI